MEIFKKIVVVVVFFFIWQVFGDKIDVKQHHIFVKGCFLGKKNLKLVQGVFGTLHIHAYVH